MLRLNYLNLHLVRVNQISSSSWYIDCNCLWSILLIIVY